MAIPSFPLRIADPKTHLVGFYTRMPRVRHEMRSGELTAGGIHWQDKSSLSRYTAGGRPTR